MAGIKPAFTCQEAVVEADRCLYCFDAPCIMACPTGIDTPGFIQKIAAKNTAGAAHTILSANILGNTAIDAVSQAKRLGAEEAIILYRRDETTMSAYGFEYALAKSERCEFMFNVSPVAIEAMDGHVTGVRLARTDESGKPIADSEFVEPFDMVVQALGQTKMTELLRSWLPGLEFGNNGRILTNAVTGATRSKASMPGKTP
ncbi:MAG: hypothetical protein CMO80_15600 [Verrucomicrobiales bacterium]|nr:hypothetical protein [Verrucomicrobiales bacterium]|tara:strand:- start:955 stop:1560 length:606 start_codon:yes stop_codon:yes gene_type:complete